MNDTLEIFDKYMSGDMQEDEKREFELQLKTDDQLRESFNDYRFTSSYISAASDLRMKKKLDDEGEILYNSESAVIRPIRRKVFSYAIAASVAFILIFFGNVIFQSYFKTYTTQELYASYYQPLPPDNFSSRSTDQDLLAEWISAMNFYRQGKYNLAAPIFVELSSKSDFALQSAAILYGGISLIELNKPDDAIKLLKRISEINIAAQEANWFIALAYLRLEEVNDAIARIKQIAIDANHYKNNEAKELLDKMKKLKETPE